jgi:hypothetical protein
MEIGRKTFYFSIKIRKCITPKRAMARSAQEERGTG